METRRLAAWRRPDIANFIFRNNRALHRPTWVIVDTEGGKFTGFSAELIEFELGPDTATVKIANGDLQVHELKHIFFNLAT